MNIIHLIKKEKLSVLRVYITLSELQSEHQGKAFRTSVAKISKRSKVAHVSAMDAVNRLIMLKLVGRRTFITRDRGYKERVSWYFVRHLATETNML